MEIIRGILDDISRPALSERAGSRLSSVSLSHSDRVCSTTPFSLIELTKDNADIQIQSGPDDSSPGDPDNGQLQFEITDEDKRRFELHRAIEEMKHLDEILYKATYKERETKRQRKELQAKLWEDLMKNRPENHSESAHEALNTKLFLALDAQSGGTEEKDDLLPVFPTQIPEWELSFEHSESSLRSSTELFEEGHQETGEEQLEGSGHGLASKGPKKQKDFVRRNIEQVSREGDVVLLSQADRDRLAELLQEIDAEEGDGARGADSEEDTCAGSGLTSEGYTPEPSEQDQLMEIDSKIQLLSLKDLVPLRDSYANLSLSQGHGSEASWKCDWDAQPEEKVLQDIKAWRGLEKRLREIQQQLEILNQGQEMTSESPDLSREQLLCLLDECELTGSCTHDLEKCEM